jgi:hypothetical protein
VAPPQLALANPYRGSYALSTDYALSSHLLGLGLNALTPCTTRLNSPTCSRVPSVDPLEVRRYCASFSYQAQSRKKPRRVVAKVEWHPGDFIRASGSSSPT